MRPPVGRRGALGAVAAAAILFGTSGVARGLGPEGLTSSFVGSWRVVIGGAALVVFASIRRQPPWGGPARPGWTLVGGLAVIGYQLTFFAATERVGVGAAAVVTIGTGPVMAGALDRFVLGRRISRRWAVGVSLAVGGIVVLSAAGDTGGVTMGWLFAVAAGCCYPVYGLAAQRLMEDRTALASIATVFGAGAALTAPFAATVSRDLDVSVGVVALVVYLGVIATAVAYALWAVGLHRLSLSDTVAVTLAEPAAAVVLSAALLDEPLGASAMAGMLAVLVGVVIATTSGQRTRPTPESTAESTADSTSTSTATSIAD